MDLHTLLTVGFVVLVAATLFVTAHAGAVAIGVLPAHSEVDDANSGARETDDEATSGVAGDERVSASRDDTDGRGGSRLTADDHERIRTHLAKDRVHRRPDDLLPSDDDRS